MISLKIDKQELKGPEDSFYPSEKEEYPYGMCLHVDPKIVEKLGIKDLDAGEVVKLSGVAKVKMVRSEGDDRSVELQITDLEVKKKSEKEDEGEYTLTKREVEG